MHEPSALRSLHRWVHAAGVGAPWLLGLTARAAFGASPGIRNLRHWSRAQRDIFDVKLEIDDHNGGRYGAPPYVFVQLNQTSLAEPFFVWPEVLPVNTWWIVNAEFALMPVYGWAYWASAGITIVRQWSEFSKRQMQRAEVLLGSGLSIGISVEGRRSPDGQLGVFKKGPVVLAIRSQATIVPVSLEGADRCWPYGDWRVRPGTIRVTLGDAVSTKGLTYAHRDDVLEHLRGLALQAVAR